MHRTRDDDYAAVAKRVMDGDDDAFEELYETLGGVDPVSAAEAGPWQCRI